jgi:sugar diacid utilization regulator
MHVSRITGIDDIGRENAELRRLVAALQHLSTLAVQNVGLDSIVEFVAARVHTAVAVVDEQLTVLASSVDSASGAGELYGEGLSHPRLAQVLEVVGPTRRALRMPGIGGAAPIIVAPVPVADAVPAFLLTLDDGDLDVGEDLTLLLTEHAATICGVILGRERVLAAAATQARHDLIEALLSGKGSDADEVRRWAAHLGYDEQHHHRVVSVVALETRDSSHATHVPAAVERFFTSQAPDAITALRGREVVVVLPELDPAISRAARLSQECISRIGETFGTAAINAGIGGMCCSARDIASSYDGARRTVEIIGRMGRVGTSIALEELGIHRLLLQVADVVQLREFAREVFGELLVGSSGTSMEYLSTLACYFNVNNSPQRAAEQLHLHRNTVTYRVRRVEELTKLDFHNYSDRLMAQVALEILDIVDAVEEIA